MSLDPDAAALVAQAVAAGASSLEARGVEGARAYLARNAARSPAGPAIDRVEDRVAGYVPVRVFAPAADEVLPVVTYFHGGGWVVGSIDESDAFCRRLAASTPSVVVSVDYRMAPEATWPAAVDDAVAAIAWVGDHLAEVAGGPTRHVALGDSAGGNVAAIAVRRATREGVPAVDHQILAYPTIETTQDRPSHAEHGGSWPLWSSDLAWFARLYVPDERDRRHPDVCPLEADVHGLPPATLLLAGCDPLRDEGLAYAAHLRTAGVPVNVQVFAGQIHGFLTFPPEVLPTSRRALELIADVVRCA